MIEKLLYLNDFKINLILNKLLKVYVYILYCFIMKYKIYIGNKNIEKN